MTLGMRHETWRRFAAPLIAIALLVYGGGLTAREPAGIPEIAIAKLPQEARETLRLIQQGGPFPYSQDGVTFGNRERLLPKHNHGYYHEYTVKTPGVRSRGARRIIAGGRGEYYYTDDHYVSFKRIRE